MKNKQTNSRFKDNFILIHPVKTYNAAKSETIGLYIWLIFLAILLFRIISGTGHIDKPLDTLLIIADVIGIIRSSSSITIKIIEKQIKFE